MKLSVLLCGTSLVAALIGVATTVVANQFQSTGMAVAYSIGLVLAIGLGWAISGRVRKALDCIEKVAAGGEDAGNTLSGIQELDRFSERIRSHAHRWSKVASNSRRESSEVEQLLAQLEQRPVVGRTDSATLQLRQLLGGLAGGARENLYQVLSENAQAANTVQQIAVGADSQSNALSETTTLVRNMSVDLVTHRFVGPECFD